MRKTDAVKILEGNPGKRPLSTAPQATGSPVKPAELDCVASKFWDQTVPELVRLGIAKAADQPALVAMCELWACYRYAAEAALADPLEKNNRCAMIGYYEKWSRAAGQFGLNPVDRDRIRAGMSQDENPLTKYGIAS